MRISTAQMFNQNINSVLNKQSATSKIIDQIASGKRVNTAGDDPVAAIGIDNLNQQNALVDQFMKNIDYATNRLALTESKLGSAETLASSMKDQMLRTINGSLNASDRQTIANEMKSSLEELLSIANSKDESGNYLFSGNKTSTKPFAFDATGQVVYSGDSGIRQAIVASDVTIGTNLPGDSAFMKAANPLGDFSVNYLPGQTGDIYVESAKITDPIGHVPVAPEQYTFDFADNGAGGLDLTVTDSAGTAQVFANFDASSPVSVNGIEVTIDGTPAAGDSFTLSPQTEVSIFETINQAIALLDDPSKANTPQGDSELAQLLNQMNSGMQQIDFDRGIAGNDLKRAESYLSTHTEEKLVNSSALSLLEDLDFAEAITELEKQQVALNAASSVFSKVGSTTLFDYI
ncbi:flagellar hook-associated protein FlgL [Shewanella alkalitolerans]|uniref:flagellar hook-associated protein FlgL n=1 Tax=Shewanella alkalitolerans TaxID=2864209 RepID=UPI001C65C42B|nr:flagellar hook-associated protein FlgL [Shewanella alkalitolerans]QYJ98904.1 flagellar hook-associated protein FlgL [Shewanella alkalitolerans]